MDLIKLSIQNKITLCSLWRKFKVNNDLRGELILVAEDLVKRYQSGDEVEIDNNKIIKYQTLIDKLKLTHSHPSKFFRMKTAFNIFNWYNSLRILLADVNSVTKHAGKPFLPKIFATLGLTYALEFVLDIGDVFYACLRPLKESEIYISRWTRFKNALKEDKRLNRMVKDALFFSLNLVLLLVTGGTAIALSVVALNVVLVQTLVNAFAAPDKHLDLLQNIEKLELDSSVEDKEKFNSIKHAINLKLESIYVKITVSIIASILFVTGSLLAVFPPTVIPGLALIGASIALAGNSIFAGFGKKIWHAVGKIFNHVKEEPNISTDVIKNQQELSSTAQIIQEQQTLSPLPQMSGQQLYSDPQPTENESPLEDTKQKITPTSWVNKKTNGFWDKPYLPSNEEVINSELQIEPKASTIPVAFHF